MLLKMYSLVYIVFILIKMFFPNKLLQYLRNNFVTNPFNRTKLTGGHCPLENIQQDLAKKVIHFERGTEGDHTAEKNNAVRY